MLYVLLTWALGKEAPRWSALAPMALALVGLAAALNVRTGDSMAAGVAWAFLSGLSMTVVYYLNANALKSLDGRLRTFAMTAVTAVLVVVVASAAGAQAAPRDGAGWTGLALLAVFYCIAMMSLFYVLPRVPSTSTGALNFEPIALLGLVDLPRPHHHATQLVGALITVGAIAGSASRSDDVGTFGVKLFHQRRPALEHRALVHVALVGDLVGVDRRRLCHQRSRRGAIELPPSAASFLQHRGEAIAQGDVRHVLRPGLRKTSAPTSEAVVAGDHRVLDQRVGGGDEHAHRANVHPGAGGKLEVLGHAAVEHDALRRIGRIGELHRVADAVEAFLVERRFVRSGRL